MGRETFKKKERKKEKDKKGYESGGSEIQSTLENYLCRSAGKIKVKKKDFV